MSTARKIQKQLFFDVLNAVSTQNLTTDYLLNLLKIKKTALYSRINGDKLLNIEEVSLLVDAFNLNSNQYFSKNPVTIDVNFPSLFTKVKSQEDFVQGLLRRFTLASHLPEVELYYISSEIPVLNYFRFKELALFKLYIYGKTVWELPHLKGKKFTLKEKHNDSLYKSFEQISNLYINIPSKEIWTTNVVDNTLNQIKYYAQGGVFANKYDVFIILDNLSSLVDILKIAAQEGRKFYENGQKGGAFALYHNEITHTNNIVMIKSEKKNISFATYDNPNYFESQNPDLWAYSINWFYKLQKRSHPVHKESERNRLILFNLCHNKIERTRKFIEYLEI